MLVKWLTGLFEKRVDTFDTYWDRFGAASNVAGVTVNVNSAESISAVYAAVAAIAESVGSLPLDVYRKTDTGREKARTHPLQKLLHNAPNDYQTAAEFRTLMQRWVLLRGNAYAELRYSGNGRIEALLPLHPDSVSVLRSHDTGRLLYKVTDWKGVERTLLADEMLHLRMNSDDGVMGRSPIAVCRDTLGLALAERTTGTATFQNGTKLSGVIETAPGTTKEQAQQIRESWAAGQAGVAQHGKTPVLPQGAKFSPMSMTMEDASYIESRRFSVEEIARLFRVPPVLIGDLREANYSNAVELGRYFVTHTLRAYLIMWEQSINRVLLSNPEMYVEHNLEGLLRGDSLNRAQFYDLALASGWMLKSEVRQLESLSAIEGIDTRQSGAPAQ